MQHEITRSAMLFLAYIDPNTGGVLFQVLAVAFAFLSGTLLVFSARIRMVLARLMRHLRGLFRH